MGCRLSKNGTIGTNTKEVHNFSDNMEVQKVDYKSRLERKMCLAKETPEPDFELSDCNLKDIPSSVFVHCRVLRKEVLNLSNNQLQYLHCNATSSKNNSYLNDLSLIRILDLRCNKIKRLPDDIYKLENLRELLASHNQLTHLPSAIKQLRYLEHLDVSYNNLQAIDEVNCMPTLRILNIAGNAAIRRIPSTLATCDNISDLVLDETNIEWPPQDVLKGGSECILKYLLTGEIDLGCKTRMEKCAITAVDHAQDALITEILNKKSKNNSNLDQDDNSYGNEDALMKEIQRQQVQKEELLKTVLLQQNEAESLVNKLQQQKDSERHKLIKDILQAEDNATLVIDKFLASKQISDSILLEKERLDEECILEKLHLEHADLRKQEILAAISLMLQVEQEKIESYQQTRTATSMNVLERENETTAQLDLLYTNYQKNRNEIVEQICNDEELQKQAVAKFIAKNDARSWALVEQLKIVEAQLSGMTQLELERKKYANAEQINELSDKRMRLTYILSDLLQQQETRKQQLLDTLYSMELQKSNDQEDFWLLQYQKLLDSRPDEFATKSFSINPLLGYNFLVNGVIHCLPFLQKLSYTNNMCLDTITDSELIEAGVLNENDRRNILISIDEFVRDNSRYQSEAETFQPTAPSLSPEPSSPDSDALGVDAEGKMRDQELSENNTVNSASECVICMEEYVKIIFLPCGHMCCCLNCQLKVDICPMCRSNIDRKVKVVQS